MSDNNIEAALMNTAYMTPQSSGKTISKLQEKLPESPSKKTV